MSTSSKKSTSVRRQFIKYVIPAIIGMLVQSIYVILDGVIVGQGIGEIGLAAINLVFPYGMIVIALSMLISVGGANVYSFYKGHNEPEKANNIFCQCLFLGVLIGGVLGIVGFFLREPLAVLAGADKTLLPSATIYLKWNAFFFLIQMIACILATFLRNDDFPKLAMVGSVVGAVINAMLDIVFILILKKGIEFAAITNGIGIIIELSFYALHFLKKKGSLRICKPKFNFGDLKRIVSNGFATFLMEFSLPTITFSFNLAIIHVFGTLGVTAYSIVGYVCAIINMTLIGVTQGAQPLMALYHGQKNEKSFEKVYKLGLRVNIVIPIILVVFCFVFGKEITTLFRGDNPQLTEMASDMLKYYPAAHIVVGATLMNILYFQTTEQNIFSAVISFLRCVGFTQVFLIIFVFFVGGKWIYFAFILGETCHLIIAQILMMRHRKKQSLSIAPQEENFICQNE